MMEKIGERMIRWVNIEMYRIANAVELDKNATYFGVRGEVGEAVKEFFMEFGFMPKAVIEHVNGNGWKRIWMPVREVGEDG